MENLDSSIDKLFKIKRTDYKRSCYTKTEIVNLPNELIIKDSYMLILLAIFKKLNYNFEISLLKYCEKGTFIDRMIELMKVSEQDFIIFKNDFEINIFDSEENFDIKELTSLIHLVLFYDDRASELNDYIYFINNVLRVLRNEYPSFSYSLERFKGYLLDYNRNKTKIIQGKIDEANEFINKHLQIIQDLKEQKKSDDINFEKRIKLKIDHQFDHIKTREVEIEKYNKLYNKILDETVTSGGLIGVLTDKEIKLFLSIELPKSKKTVITENSIMFSHKGDKKFIENKIKNYFKGFGFNVKTKLI